MKAQKVFSLLQLLAEASITLFTAGIIVPSMLRSASATNQALAQGSLHLLNIAGMTFSYTNQNLAFTVLGALVGAVTAFAIHSYPATPRHTASRSTESLPAAL